MKKAILLSVSLGVLGFASPLVHEQVVSAEIIQSDSAQLPDKVAIHQQFQVKDIGGNVSLLDKENIVSIYIDKSKSLTFTVPDNIPHYHPVVSEEIYKPGKVVKYMAEDAVVTVKYLDENDKPIQDNANFTQATLYGKYRLTKDQFNLSGYKLLNSADTSGTIKATQWDVTLKYRNLNPIESNSTVEGTGLGDSINGKSDEDSSRESIETLETAGKIEETPDQLPLNPKEAGNSVTGSFEKTEANSKLAPADTKKPEMSVKETNGSQPEPDSKREDRKNKVSVSKDEPVKSDNQQIDELPSFNKDISEKQQDDHEQNTARQDASKVKHEQQVSTHQTKSDSEVNPSKENKPEVSMTNPGESVLATDTLTPTAKQDDTANQVSEAPKAAPEKVTNAPAKTTNKPSSNNGAVKTPEPDKKATTKTSEETKAKAKDNTDVKESDHSLEKKDEAQKTAKASQTAEPYQLHGIDSQGNSLFNKTVQLTPNEAANFRTKNIEFYGYELQSTDLNTHSKVLTLHYTAKKVTFNIVNVDQDGKTLSKDMIQLDFGQTKTYTAKFIPGYQAELASKELSADNLMPEEVQFTYTNLADSSKQLAQEKHSVAAKQTDSKHKHGHGDKGDTADSHQLHDKDEAVHTDGDTQEKLPQTGEHNSYFTILTGVALLIGLVGKKLFKRLN